MKDMKALVLTILLALTLSAAEKRPPQIGKVVAIDSERKTIPGHPCSDCGALSRVMAGRAKTQAETVYRIDGPDYSYGLYDPNRHPCRLAEGDTVKYEVQKGHLITVDLDGKTCKLEIVKQVRVDQLDK
jgi:hypothetical protein